jgi:hypothetical protein
MQKFIVAEISKNWDMTNYDSTLISQLFEDVINTNYERGYILKDFRINSVEGQKGLNETIIAVFERIEVKLS